MKRILQATLLVSLIMHIPLTRTINIFPITLGHYVDRPEEPNDDIQKAKSIIALMLLPLRNRLLIDFLKTKQDDGALIPEDLLFKEINNKTNERIMALSTRMISTLLGKNSDASALQAVRKDRSVMKNYTNLMITLEKHVEKNDWKNTKKLKVDTPLKDLKIAIENHIKAHAISHKEKQAKAISWHQMKTKTTRILKDYAPLLIGSFLGACILTKAL